MHFKVEHIKHIFFITKEPYTKSNLHALTRRFIKGDLTEIDRLSQEGDCVVLTNSDIRDKLVKTEIPPYSPLEELNVVLIGGINDIGNFAITSRPAEKLN